MERILLSIARRPSRRLHDDQQAIQRGEVDPSVDVELAVMIMETWSNAITTYVLNEGMQQKDVWKWMRCAKDTGNHR
jgi:hypothetical protein